MRPVDNAHSARAELIQDLVVRDPLSDQGFHGALRHFFIFEARSVDIDLGGSAIKFTSHGPSTVMNNSAPLFSVVHASWIMRAGM